MWTQSGSGPTPGVGPASVHPVTKSSAHDRRRIRADLTNSRRWVGSKAYCSLVRPRRLGLRGRAVAAGLVVAVLVLVYVVVFDPLGVRPFLGRTEHRPPAPPPLTSFLIRNGRLLDAHGHDFVMRGVSHM